MLESKSYLKHFFKQVCSYIFREGAIKNVAQEYSPLYGKDRKNPEFPNSGDYSMKSLNSQNIIYESPSIINYSWAIISGLRYLYIVHSEWLQEKWSDISKLKNLALTTTCVMYITFIIVSVGGFAWVAIPSGWPKRSFILYGSTGNLKNIFS